MHHNASHIKENIVIFVLIFLISMMLFLIISGDRGLAGLKQVQQKKESLIQSNQSLRLKNYEAYRKIERLQRDPAYIEAIARTDLGLIRKDELVFKPHDSNISRQPYLPAQNRRNPDD